MRPRTGVVVEDDGIYINNYVLLKPVRSIQAFPVARLVGERSRAVFNTIVYGLEDSVIDLGTETQLIGAGSRSEAVARTVSRDRSVVYSRGRLIAQDERLQGAPGLPRHRAVGVVDAVGDPGPRERRRSRRRALARGRHLAHRRRGGLLPHEPRRAQGRGGLDDHARLPRPRDPGSARPLCGGASTRRSRRRAASRCRWIPPRTRVRGSRARSEGEDMSGRSRTPERTSRSAGAEAARSSQRASARSDSTRRRRTRTSCLPPSASAVCTARPARRSAPTSSS